MAARKGKKKLTGLVIDGYEDLRPTEWLVYKTIPAQGLGELWGHSDVGKTFTAVHLGVCIATGRPWFGRKTKRGTVLYVASEGGWAFGIRKLAAKQAINRGGQHLFFATWTRPWSEFDPVTIRAALTKEFGELDGEEAPPIRLVVIDTLAQNMEGDADNNAEIQDFLRETRAKLKQLSREPIFGLLVHHPGHKTETRPGGTGGRGGYSLPADVDLIMKLYRKGKRNDKEGKPLTTVEPLTLECQRIRDGEPFESIRYHLKKVFVDGENGEPLTDIEHEPVSTLIVRENIEAPVPSVKIKKLVLDEKRMLSEVRRAQKPLNLHVLKARLNWDHARAARVISSLEKKGSVGSIHGSRSGSKRWRIITGGKKD